MNLGEIKVDCLFYNKKKNIRIPICQVFNNEAHANEWAEWLKEQDEIVVITTTKQMEYGEEVVLYWW